MDKFKKIDKEFLLTDSSVNSYGFRLLTSGYLMSEFEKNPIGYYMHDRAEGVLVRWSDFRKDGDKVFAKPSINLSHPRGQRTVDEVENGFLNAASCGHFVVEDMDKNPSNPLPNQTGPNVTKWYNREASLCDIPGNYNALISLYDKDGNEINLADLKIKKNTMEKLFLTAEQIIKINLKADANQSEIDIALENLVAAAAKVPGLEQSLAAANTEKKKAEDELVEIKKKTTTDKVNNLVAVALNEKRITVALADKLKVDYSENPEGLTSLLSAMPKYESLTSKIITAEGENELADLSAKTYSELDKAGLLPKLKALSLDTFKTKFKQEFNKEYTGS